MPAIRRHYFELHELLIMAALAALGGASSSVVSMMGKTLHAVVGIPGGFQFLAGIHVLWLTIAIGLIRKPGAATSTALLKGAVELFTGNPHGLIVLALCGLAGALVDLVWLMLAGRDRPFTYMLAGGCGSASNLLVLKVVAAMPSSRAVNIGLLTIGAIAFISGVILAGVLAWVLLQALRRSGVAGRQVPAPRVAGRRRAWMSVGALGLVIIFTGVVAYLASQRAEARSPTPPATDSAPAHTIAPE